MIRFVVHGNFVFNGVLQIRALKITYLFLNKYVLQKNVDNARLIVFKKVRKQQQIMYGVSDNRYNVKHYTKT